MKQLLFGIITGAVLAAGQRASAEGEQWLQYHPAGNSARGYVSLQLDANAPAGLKMPTFVGSKPMYTAWKSPLAKDGKMLIAFDTAKKSGAYDLMYYDHNCDGNLADESAVKGISEGSDSVTFGPLPIIFDTNDGPVTYHLNVIFNSYRDKHHVYACNAGWYDGDIDIDGIKFHITLSDNDVNGTFNDKSFNYEQTDKITVNGGPALQVGNFIEISKKFYQLEVARDGAFVKIADAGNIEMGIVKAPADINEFAIAGVNGSFQIKSGQDGKVPAGKYRLMWWDQFRDDDKSSKWKMHGNIADVNNSTIVVKAGSPVELKIGEPIIGTVTFSNDKRIYTFSQVFKGQLGETVELMNGSERVAAKLVISNKAGNYKKKYSFEFG